MLHTYTPKGKVALLARGAQSLKSNNRILSQYLTEISFEYKTFKEFMALNNARIINDFKDIKLSYNNTKFASIILEILDKTAIADEKHELIYELAITSLKHTNIQTSALSFAIKMLYYIGLGINLKGDGRSIKGVSIERGSIVYTEDNDLVDLHYDDTINLLKLTYLKTENLEDFDQQFLKNVKQFIYLYYGYHLNIKIKALQ